MSRTFSDGGLNRAEREALYRRNAKRQRERDRFPFSTFDQFAYNRRRRFDAWLDSLPRDSRGEPLICKGARP